MRFGPYWLDARLAVGGTSEVYIARPVDARTEPKRLIVKRLLPHFVTDSDGRTMFEREAQLHAAISHDNVVTVYGHGVTNEGEPYLAMEYVEGCDAYRLLRRSSQEHRPLPQAVAVHIAREALRGLAAVHSAQDSKGVPLGIIHRDVTPSNVYLGLDGRVKLGDFGIARSASRQTMRNTQSAMLKGKFAYLAPEQVAGEPFDHRADLFSMATVLSEMLIGQPLFPGTGQLAVLLSIRDGRIDPLREALAAGKLPQGLFAVLERGLDRDPKKRFQHAVAFAAELKPFCPSPEAAKHQLAELVQWVRSAPSTDQMKAVRESAQKLRAARPVRAFDIPTPPPMSPREPSSANSPDPHERRTGDYPQLPSYVQTVRGERLGPWTFARLVEAIATGTVGRGDLVEYMGQPAQPVEAISEVARFLPLSSAVSTNELAGPGPPDFQYDLETQSMLAPLVRVLEQRETGVMFVERAAADRLAAGRKEMYFLGGKLHHVASSNASELLGEYLVRRGKLAREELDMALAVLPRHGGRMGDTLIALGLVDAVDIFRAIREQGRDRVADVFVWKQGKVSFYRGQQAQHVEFPLDLDLPPLLLTGLETAEPNDAPLERYYPKLDTLLVPVLDAPAGLRDVAWPPLVARVLEVLRVPRRLREVMTLAVRGSNAAAGDVARAADILLAARLVRWD